MIFDMNPAERTERLVQIVQELDALIPKDGAKLRMDRYGGASDEGMMIANELGYQRMGIELLRRSLGGEAQATDLQYLVSEDSTIQFSIFHLTDNGEIPERTARWFDPFLGYGCFIAGLILFGLAAYGAKELIQTLW